jgi:hypothetical protein
MSALPLSTSGIILARQETRREFFVRAATPSTGLYFIARQVVLPFKPRLATRLRGLHKLCAPGIFIRQMPDWRT